MIWRTTTLIAAFAFLALPAQSWTYTTMDSGTFLGASAASEDRGISFVCMGLSPQFKGEPEAEWFLPSPGFISFRISRHVLSADDPTFSGVELLIEGNALPLPTLVRDDESQRYFVLLPIHDPLFEALAAGEWAHIIAANEAIGIVSLAHARPAISALLDQCPRITEP